MAEAKKMKLDDNVSKCEGSGKYELSDDTKAGNFIIISFPPY